MEVSSTQKNQREQTIEFINEILRSGQFQQASYEEKNAVVIRLSQHPLVTANGITLDDIVTIYQGILNSSDKLSRLSRDPLYLILEQTNPEDVANLCQTTPKFANLCRDESVFIRLLKLHFDVTITDGSNPKNLYLELAATQTIPFQLYMNLYLLGGSVVDFPCHNEETYGEGLDIYIGHPMNNPGFSGLKLDGENSFHERITNPPLTNESTNPMNIIHNKDGDSYYPQNVQLLGSTFPSPGTKVWVAYGKYSNGDYSIFAARSKITIARKIMGMYDFIVDEFKQEIYPTLADGDLNDALPTYFAELQTGFQDDGLTVTDLAEKLIPFTPKAIYDYVLSHNNLMLFYNRGVNWIFFQVEF